MFSLTDEQLNTIKGICYSNCLTPSNSGNYELFYLKFLDYLYYEEVDEASLYKWCDDMGFGLELDELMLLVANGLETDWDILPEF